MGKTIENWKEMVDLYVDDECSSSERRDFKRLAAENPEVAQAVRSALKIRRLTRRAYSGDSAIPVDFNERLQGAIASSDFWNSRSAIVASAVKTTEGERRERRWTTKKTFGLTAAVLIAVGTSVATERFLNRESVVVLGTGAQTANTNVANATGEFETTPNVETEDAALVVDARGASNPIVRMPSATDSSPKSGAQLPEVVFVRIDRESANAFSRFCSTNRINLSKINGDRELLLKNITPEQWAQVVEWRQNVGVATNAADVFETTEGIELWTRTKGAEPRDVRLNLIVE